MRRAPALETRAQNYYTCSRKVRLMPSVHRGRLALLASIAAFGALPSCAATPEPQFVRAADLAKAGPLSLDRPIVIEFQEGDTIPLQFVLDGPFVKSPEGAPPIPLRVVRHFFLRVDKDGLKSSTDGKSFDWKSARPG